MSLQSGSTYLEEENVVTVGSLELTLGVSAHWWDFSTGRD